MTLAHHYLTQVLEVDPTPENLHRLINEHCPDFHYKRPSGYRPCPKTKHPGFSCRSCWNENYTGQTLTDTHHFL